MADEVIPEDGETPGDRIRSLLGDTWEPLAQLGQRWGETTTVALQNALGKTIGYANAAFAATSYTDIIEEFSGTEHVAVEVKLTFGPNDGFLLGIVAPSVDAGLLFDVDLSPAATDAAAASELGNTVHRTVAEIADLLGLMLFSDTSEKPEIAIGDVLFDRIEESIGIIADVAGEVVASRHDVDLEFGDEQRSRLTTIIPLKLLTRLAEMLAPAEEASAPAPAEAPASQEAPSLQAVPTGQSRPRGEDDPAIHAARFTPFDGAPTSQSASHTLDLIMDVPLRITVELGRNSLTVADVLDVVPCSVIELDKLAGEPVDIFVNDKLVAHGEVVVVEESFGVRILDVVSPQQRVLAAD